MRKNKKVVVSAAAVTMSVLLGACGGSTSSQATSTEAASEAETEAAESADSDQEAADKVAKLIDEYRSAPMTRMSSARQPKRHGMP